MRSLHRPGVHPWRGALPEPVALWCPEDLGTAEAFALPDIDHPAERDDGSFPRGAEPEVDAEATARERREAERLVHEKALADAYARGRDEGLAEGRSEGERAATERLRDALGAVEQACAAIDAAEEQWVGGEMARENLSALAVGIARHIIARKVSTDSKVVRDLVHSALTEFPIDEVLRIRVHPDDLAVIESAKNLAEIVGGRSPKWIADPGIERGGCLVEGREHIVDGRVDTALERVYRQLSDTHA